MTDKTRHADDATLAYIAQLESQLAAANARLAGIADVICGDMELRLSERQRSRIRALAPPVAEKVNAEEQAAVVLSQIEPAAPIPQPARGVVVSRQLLAECRDDVAECMGRESKPHRVKAYQEQLAQIDALLAAAQEPRK